MKEKTNKLNWCRVSGTADYFVHLVMKEKGKKKNQLVSCFRDGKLLCALGNEEETNKLNRCRLSGTGDCFVHLVIEEKMNKLNWCRVSGTGDYTWDDGCVLRASSNKWFNYGHSEPELGDDKLAMAAGTELSYFGTDQSDALEPLCQTG